MKLYTCTNCKNPLYFENSFCLQCSHTVGFEVGKFNLVALDNNKNGYSPVNYKNEVYRFCSNATYGTCNWLIPITQASPFCLACELNRIIPALSTDMNRDKWKSIEIAKHRLVYSLLRLKLPVKAKKSIAEIGGIVFDFMGDTSPTERVMTGHDNGVITLNIEEADEGLLTRHKLDLGEKYRTLLGHFRHEIGHYYWDVLIKDSTHLEKFRQLFGNEENDYDAALEAYYKNGIQPNWNNFFISQYASSHAWEDWAESWAHYMHMMDTLETAWSFGIGIHRREMQTDVYNDPYTIADFDAIINMWFPLTFAVNSLNRSMGHADFYPFIIPAPVIEKLRFIHEVCGVGG
ncbi:MAG: putative zinc-binding peptidase [Ferruginibacter sp.]|nr:putative zinc-binding peptidase [Ferruginibacter sp.]